MKELIQNKKIILYGDERYVRDFLYVFDNIKPAYFVDDTKNEFAESYTCLQSESIDEIMIIICKYDERTAQKNLVNIGLERGKHFISATTLFDTLDFPIKEIAKEKEVYIWGTGDRSHQFFHDFVEKNSDIEIVGCIDSDVKKKGKTFFRRPVYLPEDILDDDKIFIIVASTNYWNEIKDILVKAGKKQGVDFIHYLSVNHWASWMIRETIYGVPRLDYVCPKAFQDASFLHEGRLSICSGIPGMTMWVTPLFYTEFQDVWHSNVMKVLRLSMINGTYSFCNTAKCDLLGKCEKQEIDINELHYELGRCKEELDYVATKGSFSKNTVFNVKNYEIKEPEYPDVVMCSYDKTCNLHCPSCRSKIYLSNGQEKKMIDEFTIRLKKEVFPYIKRLKVAGDGEAFASSTYRNILFDENISNSIRSVGILSNGTLFSKEYFDRLAQNYNEIRAFISMDGATKETAEKLRRGADFDKWKENMEYLGKMRMEGKLNFLAFNFVVQRDNYFEMPEYVRMCLEFNADQIKFSKIFNWGRYTQEEFENISMFDKFDHPKNELEKVLGDEIFKKNQVKLFEWVTW